MKRILKWALALVAFFAVAVTALFLGTRGDYQVPRLVTEDASLPSQTVDGIKLHMRMIDGPADAPTVIVLHGGPGGDFRSLLGLGALSDTYQVVFYDQRGAGLSERVGQGQLTLDGYLAELGAVIDLVAPGEKPILIGHSWGAMLAAAYLGKAPERVQSAVLIEPGYLDGEGRNSWQQESRRYMSGPRYWAEALVTGFRAQHVTKTDAHAADDFLIGHMVHHFVNHPANPYHCGDGYAAPNWRFGAQSSEVWNSASATEVDRIGENLAAFDGAVLLVAGGCDDWLGATLQGQHLGRFTTAELGIVENAGHDVVWDNPEAALALIRAFLGR